MNRYLLIPSSIFLLLLGCAQTSVASYKDPAYAQITCSYPVVIAHIDDISHRQAIEDSFVSALKAIKVKGSRGLDMWPPTRNMTKEKKAKVFLESDADCLVSISLKQGTARVQSYEAAILDKHSESKIWIGSTSTRSIETTGRSILTQDIHMSTILDSMTEEVVNQLIKDGILVEGE